MPAIGRIVTPVSLLSVAGLYHVTGTLDMAAIVRGGRDAGVEWYIAEQDEPSDALNDIATARQNLEALAR